MSAFGFNVPTPTDPSTCNLLVIVEIPDVENPLLTLLTKILDVAVIEFAVSAIPVKLPTKPLPAVIEPVTLILDGNLELSNVPRSILSAFTSVSSDP